MPGMARRGARPSQTGRERASSAAVAVGVVLLLVALVVVPSGASPFRLPKEALALAGMAVIVAADLAAGALRGRLQLPSGPLAVVLATYPVLLALSALWASRPSWALAAAGRAAVWVVFVLWAASLGPSSRHRLVRWAAFGVAISAFLMLAQAAGLQLFNLATGSDSRYGLTGLAGNPADLAMSAVLLLPFLVPSDASERRRWQAWVLPGLLGLAAAVSLTMTAVAALLGLAAIWLLRTRSRTAVLGAAGGLLVVMAVATAGGLGGRVVTMVDRVRRGDWYGLLAARGDGWSAASEMVRRHPALGVGGANYTHAFYPSRLANLERRGGVGGRGEYATHFEWAHCDPLQVVAELGLLGGAWLAALLITLIRGLPRGDPLPLLGLVAAAPFLLLHYPSHIAGALVPLTLLLAHIVGTGPRSTVSLEVGAGRAVAVLLAAAAVAVVAWQAARLEADSWVGDSEVVLIATRHAPPARRAVMTTVVERHAIDRLSRFLSSPPTLWRMIGKARFARDDFAGAEQAFRTSMAQWPHEDTELFLGLALAAQGRQGEALTHLNRVCRANPALVGVIGNEQLRRSVEAYLAALATRNTP